MRTFAFAVLTAGTAIALVLATSGCRSTTPGATTSAPVSTAAPQVPPPAISPPAREPDKAAAAVEPSRTIVLEGTIVDAGDAPVADAEVSLIIWGAILAHLRSTETGRFHFEVPPGSYGLSAHHPGHVGSFIDAKQFDADAKELSLVLGASGGVVVRGKADAASLAPNAYVFISSLSSTHDGDVFAVPLSMDGTFEAKLPRNDDYRAQMLEGGQGRGFGVRRGDRADMVLHLVAPGPPPPEVVDWVSAHAVALATLQAGEGFDDLARLAPLIGNARLIGLGEATHGTREFFKVKHRVLEYLVARLGFTAFAIEGNQPESRAINDYVLHGTGDPKAVLRGLVVWPWDTEEVLAMIEWMRAWNADPAHARKVQFFGFDMQMSPAAHASIARYLGQVAPDAASSLLAPIEVLRTLDASRLVSELHAEPRARLVDGLTAIAKAFDAHRQAWSKATSRSEFDDARHDVTILEQFTALCAPSAHGDNVRDKAMAINVAWILDHQPAGTRMVVWAHNAHIAKAVEGSALVTSMGSELKARFKTSYVSVGFLFSQGGFQAFATNGRRFALTEITLTAPDETDVSVPFTRTGKAILALDLRAVPHRGPLHDWFTTVHPMRQTGSVFATEQGMTAVVILPTVYDAVIFVDRTTRARPNRRPRPST